ncbi:MAG TPA: A24 family peptidase C-terminal domain-containing protein [Methanocella sp.]|jgi:preflagellin peptidase FlaK
MALPFFPPDNALNILRVLAATIILGYSCVTDWKIRRAPNELWYVLGGIGLLFALYGYWENNFDTSYLIWFVIGVLFIYALVYMIFRVGGFGGADAKALIAIAILFPAPMYPLISLFGLDFPLGGGIMSPVFALAVLGNAVALNIIVPLGMLVYNLVTTPAGELLGNPLGAFTGYKARIADLKGKHLRLMHDYDETDNKVQKQWVFKGTEIDDYSLGELSKWRDSGKIGDKVWVTPKLPFLIPITLGFLVAIFYGDILMQVVSTLMGR